MWLVRESLARHTVANERLKQRLTPFQAQKVGESE